MNRTYPSKLILFGEYSLILGSQVLGIPLQNAFGYWSSDYSENSQFKSGFFEFLLTDCKEFLILDKVREIKESIVYYNSNIKRGYGNGSSGALAAAIYDYCKTETSCEFDLLQYRLAKIESFFHGTSSGFDPLLCYLNQAILKTKTGEYELINGSTGSWDFSGLYLFDSGHKRVEKGLVPLFVKLAEQNPKLYEQLVEINDDLIDRFIANRSYKAALRKLSMFQLEHMAPMITDPIKVIWKQGLASGDYYMKICGAGGGGYYMLYSKDDLTDRSWADQLVPIDLS